MSRLKHRIGILLEGAPMPNRSKGGDQTKSDSTGPPGWELGVTTENQKPYGHQRPQLERKRALLAWLCLIKKMVTEHTCT